MMANEFCVAYKNNKTSSFGCDGWVRLTAWLPFDESKSLFYHYKKEFLENTAVALFPCDNEDAAWYQRRPRYVANRHVLVSDGDVRRLFGDFINNFGSGWF